MNSFTELATFSFGTIQRVRENGTDTVTINGTVSFQLKGYYKKPFNKIFTLKEPLEVKVVNQPASSLDQPLSAPREPIEEEDVTRDSVWISLPNYEKEFILKVQLDEIWIERQNYFRMKQNR